ncbi:MAG: cobalamin biosynthesis protein CobD [Clostridiales bacterium]|jgi:adenosylcobinamide-phosphate synthase|nr:cobalamin biosynthesis protein CobD [Clostridiales bacterium]
MILYSTAALITGVILDLIFGDPYSFPHIVVGIGKLISALEKRLRNIFPKNEKGEKTAGTSLVLLVLSVCSILPLLLLYFTYRLSPYFYFALESFLCWQLLAAKSLCIESTKVYISLINDDLISARKAVSMIVGRDTNTLDESGIARAAVETVAENTSDGVIAPLVYIMFFGAVGGCIYKSVNTMDSMIGYKNERYIHFGRCAAKLDDFVNFIPSRLSAVFMIIASAICGYNFRGAIRIFKRDRFNHASPNSAQTESVCAGALNIRLAGSAYYFGKLVQKPYIGDDIRPIEPDDIKRSNTLMLVSSALMLILALFFRIGLFLTIGGSNGAI